MNKQDQAITIERLDQRNVSSLPVLYHAVYGRKITSEFFDKKYKTGYATLSYAGYIAYAEGHKPIAFLGAVPCELNYHNEIIAAAQLTDGMTDPAYRNNGLFVQLIEKITGLCKQNDIRFLFGFPNQHSLPVFLNKPGWDMYGKMDFFSLPVQTIPLEKLSRKFPMFTSIYNSWIRRGLKKYCTPSSVTISPVDPGISKSDNYSQYKNAESILISVCGALVRIKIKTG
jgi:GNAT superfamily N-acetyltransferase